MATKRRRKHKAKSSTALTVRKKRRKRRNPSGGVGELATILMANGPRRRRKRRRAAPKASPVKARRRRARHNPSSGLSDLLLTVGATAAGALSARYVQNLAAIKLAKDASGQRITDPAQAKAQAGKPLYVAIGAAAPVAIGAALKYGAKQHAIGNGLIQGGLAHAAVQLAGRVTAKAEPGSALYPLAGLDDDGEMLGQLQIAAAADGTKWFQHPTKGWLRYFEPHEMAQLRGLEARDQLGADDLEGFTDPAQDFAGLEARDQLGEDLYGLAADDYMSGED